MTNPRGVRCPRWLQPGFRWLVMPLLLAAGLLSLAGCGDPGTGPGDVKWDRITCERCRMVLSARTYSAQIRAFKADGKSSLHFFDDIGCALIWLEDQPWREDPRTQIWVTDWRNGAWIDARTAHYLPGKETPMQYGLGAQSEPAAGSIDFEAARKHIYEVEARFNAPIFNPGATSTAPASTPDTAAATPTGTSRDLAQGTASTFAPDATGTEAAPAVANAGARAPAGAGNPITPSAPAASTSAPVPDPAHPDQDHRHPHLHITE